MTSEEFKDLKIGDTVITSKELRVGNALISEGIEIMVVEITSADAGDLVWCKVPGLGDTGFSYSNLSIPTKNRDIKNITFLTLANVIGRTLDGKGCDNMYIAVPFNKLTSSAFLPLIQKGGICIEINKWSRTKNTSYNRIIKLRGGFRDDEYISKNWNIIYNVVINTVNDSGKGYWMGNEFL